MTTRWPTKARWIAASFRPTTTATWPIYSGLTMFATTSRVLTMGEEFNTAGVPDSAFKASTEKLEPSDKRDEFIKEITADCAHLRELAWGMRPLANADDDARREV